MLFVESLKHFVLRNKEALLFLAGFGAMHYGWYNLQRSDTMNKALTAGREKELAKEYKRLEREINENWSDSSPQKHQPQKAGVLLAAATALTEKSTNH